VEPYLIFPFVKLNIKDATSFAGIKTIAATERQIPLSMIFPNEPVV
jgi:hypothetical protein